LKPNDSQRIQRALEVHRTTGQPMSALIAANKPSALSLATIALLPNDRAELHRRIAQRFDQMLDAGFVEEVRALHARGDLRPELPSMRSVGYRQAWRFVEGRYSFDEFRMAGIAATRQLAKRQITWLRSMSGISVFDSPATAFAELATRARASLPLRTSGAAAR
ncbi:MAG: tRNA (adenosine(37)-N6)-dimethylallyltransferase, partial [Burkholderiaceae bacterium]